ncbi:MAG: pyruvate kinase, partial [Pseudomonadota bacterium]
MTAGSTMRHRRSAKILATLGPSSSTAERIKALYEAGADAFRFNFSHGTHEDHKDRYDIVRKIEAEAGRPISVVMDLQGPKLRVGVFENDRIELKAGQTFRFDLEDVPGNGERVQLPHIEIFQALETGTELLLDDGKIRLDVKEVGKDYAICEVTAGGPLSNRKGVNVPNAVLPLSALTDKDKSDLQFGLDLGADWVALSFVQRPEDVAEARRLIAGRAAIMVKIEKPAAVSHLDQIIEMADGVMVARGDLGVEMPPEDVPGLQKRMIRACRDAGKPVVVATQMLESMISAPAPTRAEASDVATAVYDGADAVMLSAETAAGQYPIEAVSMMDRIIEKVENGQLYRSYLDAYHAEAERTTADAIMLAASGVAKTMRAAAIVTYT